jgi:hypothetical protein
MLIDNTVINGIFLYQDGVTFTLNDIVIENNILYRTVVPEVVGVRPSESTTEYKEYTKYSSISTVEEFESAASDDKLVTAGLVRALLPKFISGLGWSGELETITLTSNTLNDYQSTGMYHIRVTSSNLRNLPTLIKFTDNLIFRIYKTNSGIVQELLDHTTPCLYYRSIQGTTTSPWRHITGSSVNATTFESTLREYDDTLGTSLSQLNTMINSLGNHYSFVDMDHYIVGDNQVILPMVVDLSVIKFGMRYVDSGGTIKQQFSTMDPSEASVTISTDEYSISHEVISGEHIFTATPIGVTNLKIIKFIGSIISF